MSIKVKSKETGVSVEFHYEIPDTLEGLVKKYGESTVADFAERGLRLGVQALARTNIAKPHAEIQALVNAWVPGTRGPRTAKTPLERASAVLSGMSPEDLAALIAKAKAAQHAKK